MIKVTTEIRMTCDNAGCQLTVPSAAKDSAATFKHWGSLVVDGRKYQLCSACSGTIEAMLEAGIGRETVQ